MGMVKKPRKLVKRFEKKPAGGIDRWYDSFVDYLRTECHLSVNTVAAYHRDIRRFREWLGAAPRYGTQHP